MTENETPQEIPMSDEDRFFVHCVGRIKAALGQNMSFKQATELLDVAEEGMRQAIASDALKVLIAEMHFSGGQSVEEVARALKLPAGAVHKARAEMLEEVEQEAIMAYKASINVTGNA